jgi:hypothetical protein
MITSARNLLLVAVGVIGAGALILAVFALSARDSVGVPNTGAGTNASSPSVSGTTTLPRGAVEDNPARIENGDSY